MVSEQAELECGERLETEDPARVCHLLLPWQPAGSMIAVCGYDCTGRAVHDTERCVIERHPRCFECARLDRGGVDVFLDLLDDRPF